MMELGLDGAQVGKDVGMIELEVVEDCRARTVMDELRALVAEGGVVLVGLDRRRRATRSGAPTRQFCGTPPTRKPGFSPASSSIHASSEVVVVLPCVPATASTQRPASTCSASHCGPET